MISDTKGDNNEDSECEDVGAAAEWSGACVGVVYDDFEAEAIELIEARWRFAEGGADDLPPTGLDPGGEMSEEEEEEEHEEVFESELISEELILLRLIGRSFLKRW